MQEARALAVSVTTQTLMTRWDERVSSALIGQSVAKLTLFSPQSAS